ncbi:unnamed protein product [Brachionus calyciflorus]|uniref:C2H2-type domain-containing protein n=1 Tax=Brachionus calyciflorus TaxID=104777 RepID=A0A814HAG8_9BILA|nr:unnamed protein product [Brachionus calyciflorus]
MEDSNSDSISHTKLFKCKQCQFSCLNKEEYWAHQRANHIKPEKLLECNKCSFVTEYKHHLEYHLRNHMGSKPFKCQHCDYACVNLSMLRSHLKSHSKSLQYNCGDCAYSTKYYHTLKTHLEKFNHRSGGEQDSEIKKNKKLKNESVCSSPVSQTSPVPPTPVFNPALMINPVALAAYLNPNEQLIQLQLAALAAAAVNTPPVVETFTKHDNQENFKCQKCPSVIFENKKDFKKHLKQCELSQKKDQLYECLKCELLFRNYDMYIEHKKAHENEEKINKPLEQTSTTISTSANRCNLCSYQIQNSLDYFNHLLTVHNLNLAPLLQFNTTNQVLTTGSY